AYDLSILLRQEESWRGSPVVLVNITEEDIQELGRWPLADATLATLLETLVGYGPRVIGLDMYRDIPIPPGTAQLNGVLLDNPQIIVVEKVSNGVGAGIAAPPPLKGSGRVGFNDLVLDSGGVVRRGLLFMDDGENYYYSFSLRMALLYLEQEGITLQPGEPDPQHVRLGPTTMPPVESDDGGYMDADAGGYQILLDFSSGPSPFPRFSLRQLLNGEVPPQQMQDRIVIVGVVAESVRDSFHTPFTSLKVMESDIPGITIHGYLVDQLLRAGIHGTPPVRSRSAAEENAWILLWCLLGALVGRRVYTPVVVVTAVLLGMSVQTVVVYLSYLAGWWVPVVPPMIAWLTVTSLTVAYMASHEKRQRGVLMQVFSRQVSPDVAQTIWREREQVLEDGRLRPKLMVTSVLFSDLKGFTSISESLEPKELMVWLNDYMGAMTRLVMKHGGIVDDFAGDGLKADFGVPLESITQAEIERDAMNAVLCSLEMGKALQSLNLSWADRGLPTVKIRVGINTGPVVVGTLGSPERMKFTTIGDNVNIAARLESLNYTPNAGIDMFVQGCRILVSESTTQCLGDSFKVRDLGSFPLKGKAQQANVFHVYGSLNVDFQSEENTHG
ncbi:MAG: adenylate/guanylate cyclase domain-containing protein, partial [Gammaproteobacteria bacterium]|nr:adenylate/guanylate cyclase domain-containing protein [Gammaproteobacteria bacterium]